MLSLIIEEVLYGKNSKGKKKQTLKKMNENPDQFASDNLRDDFPNYDYDDVDPN